MWARRVKEEIEELQPIAATRFLSTLAPGWITLLRGIELFRSDALPEPEVARQKPHAQASHRGQFAPAADNKSRFHKQVERAFSALCTNRDLVE